MFKNLLRRLWAVPLAAVAAVTFAADSPPPAAPLKVAFVYELKRPKGYRVHQ